MSDLAVGLGLMLVVEGLIWALAPGMGLKLLTAAASTPQQALENVRPRRCGRRRRHRLAGPGLAVVTVGADSMGR